MKELLVIVFYLFLANCCYGQDDNQWYIKSNAAVGHTGVWQSTNTFYILKLNHPILSPQYRPYNGPSGPSNEVYAQDDFFIIYMNGDHFNSRSDNSVPQFPNSSDKEYQVSASQNIQYLYHTNVYEGDDVPARISTLGHTNGTTPISIFSYYPQINSASSTPLLTANHDVVAGRDITLIINNLLLDSCSRSVTFDLCHDLVQGNQSFLEPENIFDQESIFMGDMVNSNWNNGKKCITFTTDPTSDFTYINLRASKDIPENFHNESVTFNLNNLKDCNNTAISEKINSAHDPNYIRVLCVSEKKHWYNFFRGKKKYAKYKVSCFNDGTANVVNQKFKIKFPPGVLADLYMPVATSAKLGVNNIPTNFPIISLGDNTVLFDMDANGDDLAFCNMSNNPPTYTNCTAEIEFCVRLADSFDLRKGNLKPLYALSQFDNIDYPIKTFFDPCNPEFDKNDRVDYNMDEFLYDDRSNIIGCSREPGTCGCLKKSYPNSVEINVYK